MEFDLGAGVAAGAIRIPVQSTFSSQEVLGRIYQALATIGISDFDERIQHSIIAGAWCKRNGSCGWNSWFGRDSVAPITDLAGNALQANRPNSLTQFTIAMPEVGLDYGDAIERPAQEPAARRFDIHWNHHQWCSTCYVSNRRTEIGFGSVRRC